MIEYASSLDYGWWKGQIRGRGAEWSSMLCQYVVAPLCTENSLSVIPGGKPSRLLAYLTRQLKCRDLFFLF